MLRALIATYKTLFFLCCGLLLFGCVALGLTLIIAGDTVEARQSGLGVLIGGTAVVIMMAGSLALVIENNELLRRIADGVSQPDGGSVGLSPTATVRKAVAYGDARREPKISAKLS